MDERGDKYAPILKPVSSDGKTYYRVGLMCWQPGPYSDLIEWSQQGINIV
jgi:hypothetical protein